MSAADIVYYISKAGDLVKGKGKGDMNTGAKVILTATALAGAGIAKGVETLVKATTNRKKKKWPNIKSSNFTDHASQESSETY